MRTLVRIWRLLDHAQRRRLLALQLLSVLVALSAVGGIAGVVPFFAVLADPHSIERNVLLRTLYQQLHFVSRDSFVVTLGGAFALLILLANAVSLSGMLAIDRFALKVGDTLYARLFQEYLSRDYRFHLRNNAAVLTNNVLHEVGRVTIGILQQGLLLVTNLVTIAFILASILLVNPRVAVGATVGLGVVYGVVYWVTRGLLLRNGYDQSRCRAQRAQIVSEGLGAIREIITLNARDFFVQQFKERCRAFSRVDFTTHAIAWSPRNVLECVIVCCLVAVALYLRSGSDGVGPWLAQLSFFGLAAYRLMPALQQTFAAIVSIRASHAAFETVAAELEQPACGEVTPLTESERIWRDRPHREIRVQEVSFRYAAERPPAISGLSLRIPAGAAIGFMGANGSGKTTLVDVLAGLLIPTAGRVEVDGIVLDHANRAAWRSAIAYVPQNVFLLDATLAENVALGIPCEQIDRQRLDRAVKQARLAECIASLPNGYDERVGDRGSRLSGGQRQRLGIARALYRDASVLILDEATSSLDNVAEEEIAAMLDALRPGRTLLLIAHRLSALRHCDLIHELKNGKIVRSGSYADLHPVIRARTTA
jgi:ABC-type multidrug transport system fused ATPase/permease subunit